MSHNNSGILFKNDKWTEGSNLPRYRGTAVVDGVDYEIASWIKDGKKGKFMTLSFQKKERAEPEPDDQF